MITIRNESGEPIDIYNSDGSGVRMTLEHGTYMDVHSLEGINILKHVIKITNGVIKIKDKLSKDSNDEQNF